MRSRFQSRIAVSLVALVASLSCLAKADEYNDGNNGYDGDGDNNGGDNDGGYYDGDGNYNAGDYYGGSYNADGSDTQNQGASDYIEYWTEYAILPKRCIV
jgi:hypothetical protein